MEKTDGERARPNPGRIRLDSTDSGQIDDGKQTLLFRCSTFFVSLTAQINIVTPESSIALEALYDMHPAKIDLQNTEKAIYFLSPCGTVGVNPEVVLIIANVCH